MKIKVKVELEYSYFTGNANGLTILYKTNKSFSWKEIHVLYYSEISMIDQVSFIEQLEEFISQGNVKERICNMVKDDVIENIKKKKWKKAKDNRLQELLEQIPSKITFDFDEKESIK